MKNKYQIRNYSFTLFLNVLITCVVGIAFITSADSSFTQKQIIGLILGTITMLVVSLIDYNRLIRWNPVFYIANLVLLLGVALFGKTVGGAKRWFDFGFTSLQPSEVTKIVMILFVAAYIAEHEDELNTPKCLGKLALFCAVPLLFIVKQPDLSTTLDITFVLLSIIFVGGLSAVLIKKACLIFVPVSVLFIWYIQTPGQILLKQYQVNRIMSFLKPQEYAVTEAYQQMNSIMAIGSGQLFGKGFMKNEISSVAGSVSDAMVSVKDTGLVSEQQTDFIFSVIGEEKGFIGCFIVIALLFLIVVQCIIIASKAKNLCGTLIATGMAALICFQTFINIGVATFILPNTGLPLPFISYGPTSLICNMSGIGLVLNVGLNRKY